MLSLPRSPFEILSDEHIAYQSCLNLETVGDSWGTVTDETAIMFKFSPEIVARVLGFGLIYPPSTQGRAYLARDISACNDNSEFLAGLSYLYVMGVIRICSTFVSSSGTSDNATSQECNAPTIVGGQSSVRVK